MNQPDSSAPAAPSSPSPAAALERLLEGNRRFAAGRPSRPHQSVSHRHLLEQGQRPFAAVLGCSDSRASVELLLDQGFGDVFVIRNAGHVLSPGGSALASLEYAVAELGVQAVLLMGHESCGAVAATVAHLRSGGELPGSMPILVERTEGHLDPAAPEDRAVERHVAGTVRDLLAASEIVAEAVGAGRLVVAGGVYGLHDGIVRLIDAEAFES